MSRRSKTTFRLETLESRLAPAVTLFSSTKVLEIRGSEIDDVASVVGKNVGGVDRVEVTFNGAVSTFALSAVRTITFLGRAGNDRLNVMPSITLPVVGNGGDGNDTLNGGNGRDTLSGFAGDDTINGRAGNDVINGGEDNDTLNGGLGNDTINGDFGNDSISGLAGNDVLNGSLGNDTINGGFGNDTIHGGAGFNVLSGQQNNDTIIGGADRDFIYGDDGNDTLMGGGAGDYIYGGFGEDSIFGNAGDDFLYGNAGADRLFGGPGTDSLVSLDGGSLDLLVGGLDRDGFWFDKIGSKQDAVRDAAANETAGLHAIVRFENGADRTLNGDRIADPIDGQFYKNFSRQFLFESTGPSLNDIFQSTTSTSWLQSALGAITQASPYAARQVVTDLGDGTYGVRLGGKFYRVDGDLPTESAESRNLTMAGFGQGGTIWVAIIEKAYAHFRTGANTYASLNVGTPSEALRAFGATGVTLSQFNTFADASALLADINTKLTTGKAVAIGIVTPAGGANLVPNHAYTAVSVNFVNGVAVSVTLRNPRGVDGAGNNDGADDGFVTVSADLLFGSVGGVHSGTPNG